jgi:hypothetical protein
VENNVTSTVDREKNEPISFGRNKTPLEATILRLKPSYFGHLMTAKGSLERDIMLGQVAGQETKETMAAMT